MDNVSEYIELTKIHVGQFSKRIIGKNPELGLIVSRIFNESYVVGGVFGINNALVNASSLVASGLLSDDVGGKVELFLFEDPNKFEQLGFSNTLKEGTLRISPTNVGYEAFKNLLRTLGGEILSTGSNEAKALYELLSKPHFS